MRRSQMPLTVVMGCAIALASIPGNRAAAQFGGGRDIEPEVDEGQLSDKPQALISFSLWVLTLSEPDEIPADELSANLFEQLDDVPKDFGSASEVREYIGRLKVAGALHKAQEFRLVALDQQPAKFQSGGRLPQIIATQISEPSGRRFNPPGRNDQPAGGNGPMVTNSVQLETVGTILRLVPRLDRNGSIQVQLDYSSSNIDKDPNIALSEMPGTKPLFASRVMTQQFETSVRLKSGTAIVVHSDSHVTADDASNSATQLIILAASVDAPAE